MFLLHERLLNVRASLLFFSLDGEHQVDGESALDLAYRLHGIQERHQRALGVKGATRQDCFSHREVDHPRFARRRHPKFRLVNGLYVIHPVVDEGLGGSHVTLAPHHGVTFGFEELYFAAADAA